MGHNARNAPLTHDPAAARQPSSKLIVARKNTGTQPTTAVSCLSEPHRVLCIVSFLVWGLDMHILNSILCYLPPISGAELMLYIVSKRWSDSDRQTLVR